MFERDGRVPKNSGTENALRRINASHGFREQNLFDLAIKDVSGLLCFRMEGEYSKEDLAAFLVNACSREASLNQSSRNLDKIMVESNARYHLNKLRLWELNDQVNDLLLARARVILPSKPPKDWGRRSTECIYLLMDLPLTLPRINVVGFFGGNQLIHSLTSPKFGGVSNAPLFRDI
jgi:hypothetical protein